MENKPERLVDYFVAIGLGSTAAPFENNSLEQVDHGNSCDPITDIAIIFKKSEVLPKGYKCIEKTSGGSSANLNSGAVFAPAMYVCYAQGRDKAPIIDIGAYCEDLHSKGPPKNHELVKRSLGDRDAGLSSGAKHPTFLTYKQGIFRAHNAAIAGLCMIAPAKGEEPPPGYKKLNMDLNRGRQGQALYLCYKKRVVRPPSVAYMPELLCRYPVEDYPEFPLPGNVSLFCCPFGVSVEHWESVSYPLPTFSTFALTNELGHCMYGVVVEFYEDLKQHEKLPAIKEALGVDEKAELKVNKCICILSHWPFFTDFKAFLSNLYRLSISPGLPLPLERYIGNLMLETPLPTPERPQVLQQMGSEKLVFSLPVQTPLPLSVSTHWSLLSSLDADNCVTLLSLLLLEQKVVIHSARRALVTCVAEALKSILFPFTWQCTYIPMCPLAFSSFMQAPVPFIIGIDSRYFDDVLELPEACIVDLDDNRITLNEDSKALLKKCPLPVKPVKVLKQKLKDLATRVTALNPNSDYAVEVTAADAPESYKTDLDGVDLLIREAFLQFHALLLSNYRACLKPLTSAPSEKCRDISRLFNYEQFLKHHPSVEHLFYRTFFDTQIFITFVDERSFGQRETIAFTFFDECVEKVTADPNSDLLNVKAAIHRHSDLPTVVALPAEAYGVDGKVTYSYDTFPVLNPDLFHPVTALHPPRLQPTASSLCLSTNSPTMARRTVAEKAKDKHDLERAVQNDSLWAKCLLSHVCSLWYVMLPSHVSLYWNKTGVLRQALEIFEDMRKRKALSGDEVCYRILMEQCVKLGRPALAVRVYHEMRKAGIQPNAVTYSFYNKVVLEGKWPSTRRNWNILRIVVSACFYLKRLPHTGHFLKDHPTTSVDQLGADRISLTSSISSVATAFNEIGLDESPFSRDGEAHEGKGCIFRSSNMAGDYAIHGDYLYMAHKAPFHKSHSNSKSRRKPKRGWSPAQQKAAAAIGTRGVLKGPRLDVEMTSCTQCPTCKTLLYDEEIMANWNENEANLKTACPHCSCKLVASLTINLRETLPSMPYANNSNSISEAEENTSAVFENTVLAEDASSCGSGDHTEHEPPDVSNLNHHPASCDNQLASCDNQLASCDATQQHPAQTGLSSSQDGQLSPQAGLIPDTDTTTPTPPEHTGINVDNSSSDKSRGDVTPLRAPNIEEMKARGHRRSSSAPINRPKAKYSKTASKTIVISSESESPSGTPSVTPTPSGDPESTYSTEASVPIIVPYLSPIVLRKEVELLLAKDGSQGLDRTQLVQEKPILYWNLVWYFSRLNLPTYLPLLQLGSFISDHEQLRNEYVQMKVDLLWDRHVPGTRFPLHFIWSGKISLPPPTDITKHLGTEYHLQSVVARIMCGDIAPLVMKLLEDRKYPTGELLHRSVFREALLLKSIVTQTIPDLDIFEKEYLQIIQKLQKDFSILLKPMDYCPSPRAAQCRREFGCLQVFTVSYTSHAGVKL